MRIENRFINIYEFIDKVNNLVYFIFLFTITFEAMNVKDIFFCPKMAAFGNLGNF